MADRESEVVVAAEAVSSRGLGAFAPLGEPVFRTIWATSLFSNFGYLILGVGAAWEMTKLTGSPAMVALVQSALMLPMMLVSVPSGALADMFDRRKVALLGLALSFTFAAILTALAAAGYTSPWLLLAFCSLIGGGGALYSPAWQASVREQVPPRQLPAAVALASVSYNIARSFGPAIGGVIVLVAGARAAFAVNAVCYLPLITAFFLWRRTPVPSRLPPERIDRAIVSGVRYVVHSPSIRTVIFRALVSGIAGASMTALTPIVARDLLDGGPGMYGILLGSAGAGAVVGALSISRIRARFTPEQAFARCTLVAGGAMLVTALSHHVLVTVTAMLIGGAAWMLLVSMLNLSVQMAAPRWVTARALSLYQSALTGGIAVGAWIWGGVATHFGISVAMLASAITMFANPLIGLVLPMPRGADDDALEPVELDGEVRTELALTARSGPIVIEIDYDVAPAQARQFYDTMLKLRRTRLRGGGFEWSIARDVAEPARWTERYHCPTWGDYLRLRTHYTQADLALQAEASSYGCGDGPTRVRRLLERPFGSVRWRADTPDAGPEPTGFYAP